MAELKSLSPENPYWDNTHWADMWGKAFGEAIKEEIQRTTTPITEWRVSGRKTKDRPQAEDMGWWSLAGVELSRAYASWRENNPAYKLWVTPDGEPANELEFTVAFGSVPVKVIIDRVFVLGDQLVVYDLKSGKNMPEDILQLSVYAAAVDIKYGIRPSLGAYFANRKGAIVGLEDLSEYPTEMVVGLMEDFMQQNQAGIYLPNPGRQCIWCEVAPLCPWGKGVASSVWRNN